MPRQLILAILSGGLLSTPFLDHEQFYLAWFAFVPLLFAVEHATLLRTYLIGLLAGFVAFAAGTYWIIDFITISKGYSALPSSLLALAVWLYCAHQIALMLVLFNWLKRRTRVHVFLLFPLIVSAFTSAFPMLFAMRLGESQVNFYVAIQAVEFGGVHSLDALIALFNIVVFRFLYQTFSTRSTLKESLRRPLRWPWLIATSLISVWFTFGFISYSSWNKSIANWDTLKIGIVQPNEVPSIGKRVTYPGFATAYPPEMEMTERLSNLGAEIIVWPEAQTKGYLDNAIVRPAYKKNMATLGSTLLFQDMRHIRNSVNGKLTAQYNSAIMLDGHGDQLGLYQKIKHIPFGEYLPLLNEESLLKEWATGFLGDFLNEISPGKSHQLFKSEKVNIVPLICYETTFPVFVAEAVKSTAAQANQSNGTILVGLSNDGWFGSTHQPYQHVVASVLRAVENRLPLVHVANNGPSIVVTPSGKITFISDFQRAGGYITNVPVAKSSPGSFYNKHPNLFDNLVYALLILILALAVFDIIREKNKPRQ